ncbi:uncharacterized protein LOC116348010 [Contarinia nasturtii]|uniref:uncharacterized protein LOC116348010 n=1 Tax=Contarinia nasturtii TaxID=265458 RepID=UPI0012D3EED6|nr:uncharacterized protein LOC116348010 [Contarinia nasturtii]
MELKQVECLNVVIILSVFCLGQILACNNNTRVKREGPDVSTIFLEGAAQIKETLDNGAAFKKNYSIKAGPVQFNDSIKVGFGRAMDDPTTESGERRKRSVNDEFESEGNFQRNDGIRQKRSPHPNPSIFTNQLINSLSDTIYRTKRQAEMQKNSPSGFVATATEMFNHVATIFKDCVNKVKSLVGGAAGGMPQQRGLGSNGAAVSP